jgi:NO-binding membrane sensor protein with MHYT domain
VSALVGAALSVVGVSSFFSSRGQEIAKAQTENAGDVAGLIQIKTRYGFWVTLLSLAVAATASGLVLTNRDGSRDPG